MGNAPLPIKIYMEGKKKERKGGGRKRSKGKGDNGIIVYLENA